MHRKCTFLSYLDSDTLVQFYRCRLLILKDCCSYLVEPFRSMCFGRIRIRLDPCVLVGSESVWIHVFWSEPNPFGFLRFVESESVWIHVFWSNPKSAWIHVLWSDANAFGSMCYGRIHIQFPKKKLHGPGQLNPDSKPCSLRNLNIDKLFFFIKIRSTNIKKKFDIFSPV